MNPARILVVEDEAIVARHLEISLKKIGYSVVGPVYSGEEAVSLADEQHPDLALMDVRLGGGMDGIETGTELRRRRDIPIIYLTAYADQEVMQRAITTDPFGYLLKPYDERSLHAAIEMALRKHRLEQDLRRYTNRLEEMHAFDKAILAADTPERIADVTVERLAALLPVERISFMLYLPEQKGFHVLVLPSGPQNRLSYGRFLPESLVSEDVLSGKLVVIEDLTVQMNLSAGLRTILEEGYRSTLTVPLVYESQLHGLLTLAAREPGVFRPEMVEIARDAASQAAVAIRQVLLYQSERQALAAAETLRDGSLALSQSLDVQVIVDTFFHFLSRVAPAERITLWLNTADGVVRRCPGGRAEEASPLSSLEDELMQAVLDRPAGWLVSNLTLEPRLPVLLQKEQGCWVGLPLLASGKPVGIVSLAHPVSGTFQLRHLEMARGLGAEAAIALSNAQLYAQVQAGQERLRQLGQQVITAQEVERMRISRELHDEAGQSLTALRIGLGLVAAELSGAPEGARHRLTDAIELAGSTLEQIRLLAQDLRPPGLDTLGLAATLEETCRSFSARSAIKVDFVVEELPVLSDLTRVTFYRILQEALTNVARHSQASRVDVRLWAENQRVNLWVSDNGKGFNVSQVTASARRGMGIGLIGIRERVELAGGQLRVESQPGAGTQLLAEIPYGEEP